MPGGLSHRDAISPSAVLLASLAVLFALLAFNSSIFELVGRWIKQEEYGHGFLIPVIAAGLLWSRRDAVIASMGPPSWWGPVVVLAALCLHTMGELSALFLLSDLAFIGVLIGITLSIGGRTLLRQTIVPIALLMFAIPLPYFIESQLTWRLQIVSSELGVLFIRLLDIPVYLEGNIIDLGNYKLQVVEACSGLRYLYPLLCLSFLAAYLFKAPLWQRAIVFLSAIPITIGMNSFRIGLVGILVNRWGPQMADGLIHFFEGWIIFLLCAGLLLGEVFVLARLSGKSFQDSFGAPKVPAPLGQNVPNSFRPGPMAACLVLLCTGSLTAALVSGRHETTPDRLRFATFPSRLGEWEGHSSSLEPEVEHALGLEDYLLSDYAQAHRGFVNVYVAYYASQRSGLSPHSPIVCMPGGGWQIIEFERTSLTHANFRGALPLNRAIIERNGSKQLVYYWFVQRGRAIANEYWSKWYLFADAIMKNRTDGALVRVTTPLSSGEPEMDAEARLQDFIAEFAPRLKAYLPADAPVEKRSVAYRDTVTNHETR